MHLYQKKHFGLPNWLLLSLIFFILVTLTANLLKYYFFLYNALDLAIFNNTLWQTTHGTILGSSINPPSYLGDHFAPLLLLLTPLYALVPHPTTLLVLQTLFIAAAVFPLYAIAKRYLSEQWQVIVILSFLFNPFTGSLSLFEWHTISLVPFALLLLWYFFITDQRRLFFTTLFASLLIREDVGIATAGMGIIMVSLKKEYPRALWYGLRTITPSLIWVSVATYLVSLFSLTESYKFFVYYEWLFQNPFAVFGHVVSLEFVGLLFFILLPTLFLTAFRPVFILGLLISLAPLILSSAGPSPLIPLLHYSAWFLPFLYIGVVYGLKKVSAIKPHYANGVTLLLSVSVLYFFITAHPGFAMLSKTVTDYNALTRKRETKKILLSKIPDDASVITTADFLTQLSGRASIEYLAYLYDDAYQLSQTSYVFSDDTSFILMRPADLAFYELANKKSAVPRTSQGKALYAYMIEKQFIPFVILNDYVLFISDDSRSFPLYEEREAFPETMIENEQQSDNEALRIHGWERVQSTDDHILLTLYVTKEAESARPLYFKVVLNDSKEIIVPTSFGFIPTTLWPQQQPILTRLLIDTSDIATLQSLSIEPIAVEATRALNHIASREIVLKDVAIKGSRITIILPEGP